MPRAMKRSKGIEREGFVVVSRLVLLDETLTSDAKLAYLLILALENECDSEQMTALSFSKKLGFSMEQVHQAFVDLSHRGLISMGSKWSDLYSVEIHSVYDVYFCDSKLNSEPKREEEKNSKVVVRDSDRRGKQLSLANMNRMSLADEFVEAMNRSGDLVQRGEDAVRRRNQRKKKKPTKGVRSFSGMDAEAIASIGDSITRKPKKGTRQEFESVWFELLQEYFPQSSMLKIKWNGKMHKQAATLCDNWGVELMIRSIQHLFRNWDRYQEAFHVKTEPTLGWILGCQEYTLSLFSQGDFGLPMTTEEKVAENIRRADDERKRSKSMIGEYEGGEDASGLRLI